jgi:hypothetical protein
VTNHSDPIDAREAEPEGALCALLCEDRRDTYMIPFSCLYAEATGWLNARTGKAIGPDVIGWREWETQ